MKKRVFRKSAAAVLVLTASLTVCSSFLAFAEKNAVNIPIVEGKQGLKEYIDNDGDLVSDDTLETYMVTDPYQIVITEPETLYICPLDTDGSGAGWNEFTLYSNKALTARVYNMEFLQLADDPEKFGEIHLEPGTYYFTTCNNCPGATNRLVTFLGLRPDDTESLIEDGTEEVVSAVTDEDTNQTDLEEENKRLKEEIEFLKQIMEEAGIEITDF